MRRLRLALTAAASDLEPVRRDGLASLVDLADERTETLAPIALHVAALLDRPPLRAHALTTAVSLAALEGGDALRPLEEKVATLIADEATGALALAVLDLRARASPAAAEAIGRLVTQDDAPLALRVLAARLHLARAPATLAMTALLADPATPLALRRALGGS
jgi:hypothetical protein